MIKYDTNFLCFLYVKQMKVTCNGSGAALCPTFLLLQQSLQLHDLNFGLYEFSLLPLKLKLCFEQSLIA